MEILLRSSLVAEFQPRRTSTETILSVQGKETDVVHDTSDSDSRDDGEWEPVTEPELQPAFDTDTSGSTDTEIISTKVIEVTVADDGDLQLADSELTTGSGSELDSELDLLDFWKCARCSAANNNPLYRYCESCFKVRKNFFPPRPKRKQRWEKVHTVGLPRTLSQDSGVESQDLSQGHGSSKNLDLRDSIPDNQAGHSKSTNDFNSDRVTSSEVLIKTSNLVKDPDYKCLNSSQYKRRADSADRRSKRIKIDYSESDSEESECDVVKSKFKSTDSDNKVSLTKLKDSLLVNNRPTNKHSDSEKHDQKDDNLCIVCCTEPKSGVFVHGRIAHICCCYKCAVKVWAKSKRCPVCNCKVYNLQGMLLVSCCCMPCTPGTGPLLGVNKEWNGLTIIGRRMEDSISGWKPAGNIRLILTFHFE